MFGLRKKYLKLQAQVDDLTYRAHPPLEDEEYTYLLKFSRSCGELSDILRRASGHDLKDDILWEAIEALEHIKDNLEATHKLVQRLRRRGMAMR
jgi:hypothetical protein